MTTPEYLRSNTSSQLQSHFTSSWKGKSKNIMTSSTTTSKVPLVVYQHQPTGVPVIKDGLAVISEAVLKSILEARTISPYPINPLCAIR